MYHYALSGKQNHDLNAFAPSPTAADLRIGGRWFDPRLCQYSFRVLMVIIATGLAIILSLLSVVSKMVMWESSQWLGKNIVRSTG